MDGWSITILAVQYQVIALIRQRSCKPSSLLVTIDCHAIKCHRAEPMINSLFESDSQTQNHTTGFYRGRTFCQMPSISRRHFGSASFFIWTCTNKLSLYSTIFKSRTNFSVHFMVQTSQQLAYLVYYCLKHFKNA